MSILPVSYGVWCLSDIISAFEHYDLSLFGISTTKTNIIIIVIIFTKISFILTNHSVQSSWGVSLAGHIMALRSYSV